MMAEQVVLAIDTSTDVCVALARGGEVLATARVQERMQHVEQLMPMVRQVCADAELGLSSVEAITVGVGPGPFTGLRVGIVTAQVLASVLKVPLHGVCSLDVIATQWVLSADPRPDEFVVAIDARRKEIYWASYDADGLRVDGPHVTKPEQVPTCAVIGPGADLYPDRMQVAPGPRLLDPGVLAACGSSMIDAGIEPLYLRRPDAAEPSRRKSTLISRPQRVRP